MLLLKRELINILVVGAEVHSFGLDFTDEGRGVSVILEMEQERLFFSASEDENEEGVLAVNMHSEGKYAEELAVKFPGTKLGWMDRVLYEPEAVERQDIYPVMNGNFVFKHAVIRFPETMMEALTKAGNSQRI